MAKPIKKTWVKAKNSKDVVIAARCFDSKEDAETWARSTVCPGGGAWGIDTVQHLDYTL